MKSLSIIALVISAVVAEAPGRKHEKRGVLHDTIYNGGHGGTAFAPSISIGQGAIVHHGYEHGGYLNGNGYGHGGYLIGNGYGHGGYLNGNGYGHGGYLHGHGAYVPSLGYGYKPAHHIHKQIVNRVVPVPYPVPHPVPVTRKVPVPVPHPVPVEVKRPVPVPVPQPYPVVITKAVPVSVPRPVPVPVPQPVHVPHPVSVPHPVPVAVHAPASVPVSVQPLPEPIQSLPIGADSAIPLGPASIVGAPVAPAQSIASLEIGGAGAFLESGNIELSVPSGVGVHDHAIGGGNGGPELHLESSSDGYSYPVPAKKFF